jgi:hypothetical protein
MFAVSEIEAAVIRRVFEEEGELSAMIELRRRFPGIIDNAAARVQVRIIAGWAPLPPTLPRHVTRLRGSRRKGGA